MKYTIYSDNKILKNFLLSLYVVRINTNKLLLTTSFHYHVANI